MAVAFETDLFPGRRFPHRYASGVTGVTDGRNRFEIRDYDGSTAANPAVKDMYSMSPNSGPLLSDEESIRKYKDENEWGLHIAVDLGECDHAKICDGEYIKKFAVDLADHINMKRYGEPIAVRFGADPKVQGYSLIQLIETSCIAGHFAEDTDRAFIDVFSCREFPPEATAEYCRDYFGAKKMQYATLFRDI